MGWLSCECIGFGKGKRGFYIDVFSYFLSLIFGPFSCWFNLVDCLRFSFCSGIEIGCLGFLFGVSAKNR